MADLEFQTRRTIMKYIIDFKDPFLSNYSGEYDEVFETRERAEKRLAEYSEDDRKELEIIEIEEV